MALAPLSATGDGSSRGILVRPDYRRAAQNFATMART